MKKERSPRPRPSKPKNPIDRLRQRERKAPFPLPKDVSAAGGTRKREKDQTREVMDYEDQKKMAGLEDIGEFGIKIINLERQIEILVERSSHHHDLRHVILHWVAGATAGAAVLSFESIRETILSGSGYIPDAVFKALEALVSSSL
ncbi:hypothetical protein [Methylobacterium sp. J-070]|uniref:hypothetical protein n=1 Tax=Methylobacterium sp. J-070 TaxID=2836650 RepID=UPI001FB8CBCB|nr:hypothetical protein [Methylobacterium sp. J-070]MCJ2050877.1 hypothetical protein [Methylobacterium sp. J-070]